MRAGARGEIEPPKKLASASRPRPIGSSSSTASYAEEYGQPIDTHALAAEMLRQFL